MGSGPRGAAQNYVGNQSNQINNQRDNLTAGLQTTAANANTNYANTMNTAVGSSTGGRSNSGSIFNPSSGTYTDMATNGVGSINPAAISGMNNAAGQFGQVFNQPIDPTTQQQMLANGSFQNFADTGGYSQSDLQNIRARALSPLAATAANAQQGINQTRALQGGFSPNTTAALAHSVRDLGYGSADASTNAEAQIAQMVNQGKQFGATGMSGAATNIADLTQRGKLAGAQGQAQVNSQIAQLDAQLKASGAAGLSDQEKTALAAQLSEAGMSASTNASAQGNLLNAENATTSANLGLTGDYLNTYNLPTGFGQVMGNIGSVLGPIANAAGGIAGALPTSFGSSLPSGGFTGSQGSYGNVSPEQWQNFGR